MKDLRKNAHQISILIKFIFIDLDLLRKQNELKIPSIEELQKIQVSRNYECL